MKYILAKPFGENINCIVVSYYRGSNETYYWPRNYNFYKTDPLSKESDIGVWKLKELK